MRVILNDGRQMAGQMLAFDKVILRPFFPSYLPALYPGLANGLCREFL